MRFIAQKAKFVCVLLTIILSVSFFTGVVFADDEPQTIPAGDEQPRRLGTADPETNGQSASAGTDKSDCYEVLHNVSSYVGPDSIEHCRTSPRCDRSHSSRGANLALAQCAPARAAIPCLILNLIVLLRG